MIDLNEIKNMKFENNEIPVFISEPVIADYFLTKGDIVNMPDNKTDIPKLKVELSDIFQEVLNNYAQLESKCDIKRDTFQKMLKHKNGRNITYRMLARFVVGCGLSPARAEGLFAMAGLPLDPERNRYDYVLLCELNNGCDLTEFDKDLIELGCPSILSIAD